MLTVNPDSPLTLDECATIQGYIAHYPTARAACIDALKHVQKNRRYVSDICLQAVADLLEMSSAELDEVATFYNLIFRKPVGKSVILLCDSVSCWIMGRDHIKSTIEKYIGVSEGQTSHDKEFTLLPIVCLGHCDHAPAMMVGEKLVGNVTQELLLQILKNDSGRLHE